jgi:two-component system NtrC family response regulator
MIGMEKPTVLIVEDDDEVRSQMKWALAPQFSVVLAEDRRAALQVLKQQRPAVVTLDLGLPPSAGDTREGFAALSELLQFDSTLKIVVITGQDDKQNGMRAIAEGAYDFFCKPVNIQELQVVLSRAVHVCQLERDHRDISATDQSQPLEGIIGNSPQMRAVFGSIHKLSGSDASVLIVGESGTGKELVARAIHRLSSRQGGPFVAINCGAIPDNLLESELFGHEKGAFTGAHVQRQGRIEMAQRGTLLLDEIGELTPALQVKLLRFLQEREIERVGGRSPIKVDVRVIAATNADLTKAMSEGRFREDLYYRLAVVVIPMPRLRDREGDILLLANAFLQHPATSEGKTLVFTPRATKALEAHAWPGNVRELENRVQRAAIMAENGKITPQDLGLATQAIGVDGQGLGKAREALERQLIEAALTRTKGNVTRAAAELAISRPTLYELMDKLGMTRK